MEHTTVTVGMVHGKQEWGSIVGDASFVDIPTSVVGHQTPQGSLWKLLAANLANTVGYASSTPHTFSKPGVGCVASSTGLFQGFAYQTACNSATVEGSWPLSRSLFTKTLVLNATMRLDSPAQVCFAVFGADPPQGSKDDHASS